MQKKNITHEDKQYNARDTHSSFVIDFFLYMSLGKFSYCGISHFSHRYCDTHIKYIFIGFDDISTEYPKNFKERPMVI